MQKYKFKAGAGSAEINLPDSVFPTDRLNGVHDTPHVRVLVMEAGEKAAVVALEMVVLTEDCIDTIRHTVEDIMGVPYDNVWVHVTHAITTPHFPGGPSMRADGTMGPPPLGVGGPGGKGPNPNGPKMEPNAVEKRRVFMEVITGAAKEAVEAAAADFGEARYALLSGDCDVNCSRDIETPDGVWTGINPDGFSIHRLQVLRVEHEDGSPLAFLMSYGMKSTAIDMAGGNDPERKVSTDVPGAACTVMEEHFGVPCMFCTSAGGDQVPREQAFTSELREDNTIARVDLGVQKGYEIVERLGRELGETAIEIASQETETEDESVIMAASSSIVADTMSGGGRPDGPSRTHEYKAAGKADLSVGVISLGDIAFVSTKPETNSRVEAKLDEDSPFDHTIFMTMVNGDMKYMPEKEAYDNVTPEALSSVFMPGTAEKWEARAVDMMKDMKEGRKEPVITVIADPDPEGQVMDRVMIEFDGEVPDVEDISVVNRTVTGRSVDGNVVTLELSPDDKEASVIPRMDFKPGGWKHDQNDAGPDAHKGPEGHGGADDHKGPDDHGGPDDHKGPGGPGGHKGPRGPMGGKTRRAIKVEVMIPGYEAPIASQKACQPVIDDFTQYEYKKIPYNLFRPADVKPGEKYPLMIFIPDAGQNGDDPFICLAQGTGAVCWAMPEEQAKHPSYVLGIQIPTGVELTADNYTVSPEFDTVWEIINKVVDEEQVDRDRIYCTGQSQGCMAFCEMNLRHPDFFAASMLVSGHWDIDRMSTLTDSRFLFALSEGGQGEFPCFNAITDNFVEQGVDLAKVRLNYREGWEVNERKVREAIGDPEKRQMVYIIFDKDTAFPDDGKERPGIMHHQRGWELSYQLESARDWVYAQHK